MWVGTGLSWQGEVSHSDYCVMRILEVSRYKTTFPDHTLPFVREQGEALLKLGNEVDYYLVKGNYLKTKELKKKIADFSPDMIHAHYGLSAITAVLQKKIPVVTTFHNGEILSWKVNFITSLFSLRAKHVIYVAQHIYDKCVFKRKNRYTILPCGIDLDECELIDYQEARSACGFDPNKKYVLFGGGFANLRKNYPLLKEAIDLTGRTDIEVLEMKGLSRVEISRLMCACDVFALPTKSEGSPQALKEAMASNCPIVATDVADIRYLLGDLPGHYICSFDPQNVADNLLMAISFGKRTSGRQRILDLHLTNDRVAEKLMAIYQSVI